MKNHGANILFFFTCKGFRQKFYGKSLDIRLYFSRHFCRFSLILNQFWKLFVKKCCLYYKKIIILLMEKWGDVNE